MGKTRRKEKTFSDSFYDLDEYVSDTPKEKKRRDKAPQRPQEVPEEDLYEDEDYGSFEKMGKRK